MKIFAAFALLLFMFLCGCVGWNMKLLEPNENSYNSPQIQELIDHVKILTNVLAQQLEYEKSISLSTNNQHR